MERFQDALLMAELDPVCSAVRESLRGEKGELEFNSSWQCYSARSANRRQILRRARARRPVGISGVKCQGVFSDCSKGRGIRIIH